MYAVAIVGTTGTGKTTHVKELIRKSKGNFIVYDVNNEYGTREELPTIEDFMKAANRKRNCLIIFEEATIFFSNRSTNKDLRELLVRKRHTNNFIVLVFHSIRTIPKEITDLLDFIYLRKTNDTEQIIDYKFGQNESLLRSFNQVKQSNDRFKCIEVYLR